MRKPVRCTMCRSLVEKPDGPWLRARREAAGLGLREFARKIDVTASYLSQVELGKQKPSLELIEDYEKLVPS